MKFKDKSIDNHNDKLIKKEVITKDKFQAYLDVRDSGLTNMFDIPQVIEYAKADDIELTKEDCLYIMKHFSELEKKYSKVV